MQFTLEPLDRPTQLPILAAQLKEKSVYGYYMWIAFVLRDQVRPDGTRFVAIPSCVPVNTDVGASIDHRRVVRRQSQRGRDGVKPSQAALG